MSSIEFLRSTGMQTIVSGWPILELTISGLFWEIHPVQQVLKP
jgi:hypothetical protein